MTFDFKKAFIVLCAASLITLTACSAKSSDVSSAESQSEPTVSSSHEAATPTVSASLDPDGEPSEASQAANEQGDVSAPPRVGGSGQETPQGAAPLPNASSSSGSVNGGSTDSAGSGKSETASSSPSASATEQIYGGDNAEVNISEFY